MSIVTESMVEVYKLGVKRDYDIELPDAYVRQVLMQIDAIITQRHIWEHINRDVWRLLRRADDNHLTLPEEAESVHKFFADFPHPYWEEGK